jgi:hypothetical protein
MKAKSRAVVATEEAMLGRLKVPLLKRHHLPLLEQRMPPPRTLSNEGAGGPGSLSTCTSSQGPQPL